MCLILFAYQTHPRFRLIVAANRDEFFERPTKEAHYWNDAPTVLAGRDLQKLGTWMGVTTTGKFAAITNYRDPNENLKGKKSRGDVVANFLKNSEHPEHYLEKSAKIHEQFPGYNLLVGDKNNLFYYSNISNEIRKLEPGIYGLSNDLLNTDWPKVKLGKDGLRRIISKEDFTAEDLFLLLKNNDKVPDELLPQTGVSLKWERILSPLFIESESYGTRSSTVMFMTDTYIDYYERTFHKENDSTRHFSFQRSNV